MRGVKKPPAVEYERIVTDDEDEYEDGDEDEDQW
jgi:hypothetical protein